VAEASKPTEFKPYRPPPWFVRVLTPGHGVAALLALVALYFAWGRVFAPGGTGSNVVLGLLLVVALLYLATVNLGPTLDAALFERKDALERKRDELVRYAESVLVELGKRIKAKRKRKKTGEVEEKYEATIAALDALRAAEGEKDIKERSKKLEELLTAVDDAADQAMGRRPKGLLGQLRSLSVAFAFALALRAFVVEPFQIPSGSMIPTLTIGDHLFVARCMYGLPIPLTTKYLLRWKNPDPGDVVVFVAPEWVPSNAGEDWIKRVIAGPGQTVKMRDSVLYVDGQPYSHVGTRQVEEYDNYDDARRRWTKESAQHDREKIGDRAHSIFLSNGTMKTWPVPIADTVPRYAGLDCTPEECRVKDGYIFVMGDNRDRSSDGRIWGAVPVDNVKGRALFIWMSVNGSENSLTLGRFTLPKFEWGRIFDGVE
jgi:signal peptidase I